MRLRIDGEIVELAASESIRLKKSARHTIEAVVDRLVVRDGIRVRLTDSIETALKWGESRVIALRQTTVDGAREAWEEVRYPTNYGSADNPFSLGELTPRHFSFNSHLGSLSGMPRTWH